LAPASRVRPLVTDIIADLLCLERNMVLWLERLEK
jgi:hypothetical protein